MQRKPGFPSTNCSIKLPDNFSDNNIKMEPDLEVNPQKRQQLINFAHSQWGLNGWSWVVTKQDLDFVDFINGKYSAGVAAFVSVTVKGPHIHRGDVGYANTTALTKGAAIHQARKCAVTNALRETLLSFGGSIATDLMDLLDSSKTEQAKTDAATSEINIPKVLNPVQNEVKNVLQPHNRHARKECSDANNSRENSVQNPPAVKNIVPTFVPSPVINTNQVPQMVNSTFPANQVPTKPTTAAPVQQIRPNSNVSFVLQPVIQGMMPYGPPSTRMPIPPHIYPNSYYPEYAPWGFTYDGYDHRQLSNVNLNFNNPPKNLVVKNTHPGKFAQPSEHEMNGYVNYGPAQGCWIKPTIFYDGFWTEQKVKKWVSEQADKQSPDDSTNNFSPPVQTLSSKT